MFSFHNQLGEWFRETPHGVEAVKEVLAGWK
jgi:hypothetical protein